MEDIKVDWSLAPEGFDYYIRYKDDPFNVTDFHILEEGIYGTKYYQQDLMNHYDLNVKGDSVYQFERRPVNAEEEKTVMQMIDTCKRIAELNKELGKLGESIFGSSYVECELTEDGGITVYTECGHDFELDETEFNDKGKEME